MKVVEARLNANIHDWGKGPLEFLAGKAGEENAATNDLFNRYVESLNKHFEHDDADLESATLEWTSAATDLNKAVQTFQERYQKFVKHVLKSFCSRK